MSIDLSIVIPAFNESRRIRETLRNLDAGLRALSKRYEIIVVDDGSTDSTVATVEALAADIPRLRCLPTTINRGKGHAVRVGMLAASGHVRLMMDADGAVPVREIPRAVEPVFRGRADIVIGSRYVESSNIRTPQPRWRILWSRLCNQVVQRTLIPGVRDTQCGFKAFSARAAETLFSMASVDGWSFDLEILALARGRFEVVEVGVEWSDDTRSRVRPFRDFVAVTAEWWHIVRRVHASRALLDSNA